MIPQPDLARLPSRPSVILVGDQNVVATSTFDWFDTSMRSQAAATHPIAESAP